HAVVAHWASRTPDALALINHDRGREVTWRYFDEASTALARQLVRMGFRKGDFLAASLPFLTEHVFLEYACFKIGVIHAPLDLRLPPAEVIRCLEMIRPRGYTFPGSTRAADFRELGRAVARHCPYVANLIQVSPTDELIEGAECYYTLGEGREPVGLDEEYRAMNAAVGENDGALVIFTTGSTGAPKPALLSHRNITCQNFCLAPAFGFSADTRVLVNLPPSHVGGQTEELMTTLFCGGTAVLLEIFDAARSLDAVSRHRVNLVGQIPAMFNFEWRLTDYGSRDLSSLRSAIYGGQQVSRPFLEKLAAMAPHIGTGLGLTETAGFCTYTLPGAGVEEILDGLGHAMPVYPMSIRQPMREDGAAGEELPDGELGQVCFRGPQTFLGYVNDPVSTARTISSDGWLYTGDMGFRDSRGLHFAGRAKWVIKPAGYQVFPAEVENHLCALEDKVQTAGVVGMPHALLSEGIVAFIEKKPGAEIQPAELKQHARGMASWMRPLHYVLLEPGAMPLNRAAKVDYVRLEEMARAEVARLREGRRWDGRESAAAENE
ncbi:MAG TPA: class I adenylate-forming enzyme family protein, partial [Bryobacteraceae bacterium]|nr:class I adenylate-forming enzyme family protein [Bryobacteraceae bacterium]